MSAEDLRRIGERVTNAERLFNPRCGLTPADDTLPARMFKEPIADGPAAGHVVNLEPMLVEYYAARSGPRDGLAEHREAGRAGRTGHGWKLSGVGVTAVHVPYAGPRSENCPAERYIAP